MDPQTESELLAGKLYDDVKKIFPDEELTLTNMFPFVRLAMETAEKFENLPGKDKKKLVIRAAQKALEDYVLKDQDELKFFVDVMLDMTIDQLVDIDLGHLAINEDKKHKIKTFFKKIFCCSK